MRVRHVDARLERAETDPAFDAGLGRPVVRAFRKVMGWIRDADDERDFYALRSLHYEKLKGKRSHQRSMRLNDQFRLILEIEPAAGGNIVIVVRVEDYH
jgi:proteic killer suppression protein